MHALSNLKIENVEFVVFGRNKRQKDVGQLYDDISLVTLYSAVDEMIVPNKEENLCNIIIESLACGTPVVSSNNGGNADLIDHKKNGYLTKPYNVLDLRDGIEWVLSNSNNEALIINSREKILNCFDFKKVAQKYISFYERIIE